MSSETARKPPYVSYITFKNAILALGHDGAKLPARIDASCLPGMAGGTQSQFLVAMRYLGLIDDVGKPLPVLAKLSSADAPSWKMLIGDVLKERYPNQVAALADGTPAMLKATFDEFKASGDVAEKSIRFFLTAAKEAGLPMSKQLAQAKSVGANRRSAPKPKVEEKPAGGGGGVNPAVVPPVVVKPEAADQWLAKYPNFDPSWSPEIQTKWFEGYAKLMSMKGGG